MSEYAQQVTDYKTPTFSKSPQSDKPLIQSVADQSYEHLQTLHQTIAELSSRLSPYSVSEPPSQTKDSVGEGCQTSFHGRMLEIRTGVMQAHNRLEELIARLRI